MQARREFTDALPVNRKSELPLSTRLQPEPLPVLDAQGRWSTLSGVIDLWLASKYARTQSECTLLTYRESITSLHAFLLERGLDLDRPAPELVLSLQDWANLRSDAMKHRGGVSLATYNQRIAAISSFYQWVIEKGIYQGDNPARQLSRVPVQKYATSRALNPQQVAMKLKEIDRTTSRGLRDYTLLQVALNTGRSLQELASLTWGCLYRENEIVTLTFQRCRGGKTLYDRLDSRLSKAVLLYVRTIYGEYLDDLEPQAPLWVSFSDRNYNQGIGPQTIADICKSRLGCSTVQSLRHTFAIAMEQQGAGARTIQQRLGNASTTETDRYLARLKKNS